MSRILGRNLVVTLLVLFFSVDGGTAAEGQLPACSAQPPYFCADASYFLRDGSYMLEVYFSICNEGLQFIRTDKGFEASADLSIVLLDNDSNQIAGDTYRMRLHSPRYRETTSVDSCHTRVVSFKASSGDFKMTLTVYDRDSRTKSSLNADAHIASMTEFPSLSGIQFLSRGGDIVQGIREGYRPNVKRIYDDESEEMAFYYEVYHNEGRDSVGVSYEITDSEGSEIYRQSKVSVGGGAVSHLEKIPVDTLSNGHFVLKVEVVEPGDIPAVSRSAEFEVQSESFYWERNIDKAVAVLTYIAASKLIDAFVDADVDERKRIWEQFWREKDPTPSTPTNEFYEEHLRRFEYANEHFSGPLSEGWSTDRGRIYILHGEPDEVHSYPFEMNRQPMEIWYYFSKGKRFVFVDETGFGDYVLVSERG